MQFTIRTILLVMVFLAASMGTFSASTGTSGAVLGMIMGVVLLFACISIKQTRHRGRPVITRVAIWSLGLIFLFMLFIPATGRNHASDFKSRCTKTMKQLATGIANYHKDYRKLPPICTTNDAAQPLHSWRTLLLPYLNKKDLYSEIDLASSWNSNSNKPLVPDGPLSFQCHAAWRDRATDDEYNLSDKTDYVAVVGKGTMWPKDDRDKIPKIVDPANTIMLIEIGNSDIYWSEPRDLSLDEVLNPRGTHNLPFINSHNRFEELHNDRPDLWFFHLLPGPYHVVTADGQVHQLPEIPNREELIALFDPGPKSINIAAISKQSIRPRPRWSAILSLTIMLTSYVGIWRTPFWTSQEGYSLQDEKLTVDQQDLPS